MKYTQIYHIKIIKVNTKIKLSKKESFSCNKKIGNLLSSLTLFSP